MAQKKINDKRIERREKSERNMNRAVVLLIAGLVAEWYLLMADRYYARGTIDQMLGWYDYFGVMRWIGLAVLLIGVVLFAMREKKPLYAKASGALLGFGVFFGFTSEAMRHYYPVSVTVLCVMVPVLLILGIVYLFYQAEFSVQATALAMALGALALLGRSASVRVKACAVLSLIGIAVLCAFTAMMKKNDGVYTRGGVSTRLFAANTDYRLTFGVLALCFVPVVAALASSTTAFYSTWALAVVSFVLAVYYTIKLM